MFFSNWFAFRDREQIVGIVFPPSKEGKVPLLCSAFSPVADDQPLWLAIGGQDATVSCYDGVDLWFVAPKW